MSAEGRDDATASRLVRVAPAPVVKTADGVLDAGAPGVAVSYRDTEAPSTSWTVRRGMSDIADKAPIGPGASSRIGSVTKTYLAARCSGRSAKAGSRSTARSPAGCPASCRASTRSGVSLYGNMGGLAGYTTWVQSTADGWRTIAVAANTD